MLRAVRSVSESLLSTCLRAPFRLEQITSAVIAATAIDHVVFVGYDVPRTNPIWGSFQKWSRRPSVYSPQDTIVEIRYAKHLSLVERRFVVAKELCHALDSSEGVHSVTDRSLDRLVAEFSLISSTTPLRDRIGQPMQAEILAEMVATELISPVAVRRAATGGEECTPDRIATLAAEHGIPEYYAPIAFNPSYMRMLDVILRNGS